MKALRLVEKIAIWRRRCVSCACWIRPGDRFFAPLGHLRPCYCVDCHGRLVARPRRIA
jgi:hypothetical protein